MFVAVDLYILATAIICVVVGHSICYFSYARPTIKFYRQQNAEYRARYYELLDEHNMLIRKGRDKQC